MRYVTFHHKPSACHGCLCYSDLALPDTSISGVELAQSNLSRPVYKVLILVKPLGFDVL